MTFSKNVPIFGDNIPQVIVMRVEGGHKDRSLNISDFVGCWIEESLSVSASGFECRVFKEFQYMIQLC